jgi:hypothetical protein
VLFQAWWREVCAKQYPPSVGVVSYSWEKRGQVSWRDGQSYTSCNATFPNLRRKVDVSGVNKRRHHRLIRESRGVIAYCSAR